MIAPATESDNWREDPSTVASKRDMFPSLRTCKAARQRRPRLATETGGDDFGPLPTELTLILARGICANEASRAAVEGIFLGIFSDKGLEGATCKKSNQSPLKISFPKGDSGKSLACARQLIEQRPKEFEGWVDFEKTLRAMGEED
uniref:Uncharacterized protein n=1 Tax=Chromera velia CCMP2878 TaxID=1169474 RepID=A0A0G4IDB0_9ALVE|eukprot:Cvel_13339.t1-p1 / transcript=Cvel_13339.t1 / gene=Cvel_13339 / organism=Chromera_velia_CCMP2878 / gene_product=hypothetical protein / transcript_product=hypothetical protein / location=Cvel_scaffold906:14660-15915(+) / protein_length=145 / sequence_SO=supercontig / SO=protein_coding / is_pseudo=false